MDEIKNMDCVIGVDWVAEGKDRAVCMIKEEGKYIPIDISSDKAKSLDIPSLAFRAGYELGRNEKMANVYDQGKHSGKAEGYKEGWEAGARQSYKNGLNYINNLKLGECIDKEGNFNMEHILKI